MCEGGADALCGTRFGYAREFVLATNQTIGIELAPELPLEEPIFLVFLCYLVMNLFQLFRRFIQSRSLHSQKVEERS